MPHVTNQRAGQPGNARRRRQRGCGSLRGHHAHAPRPPVATGPRNATHSRRAKCVPRQRRAARHQRGEQQCPRPGDEGDGGRASAMRSAGALPELTQPGIGAVGRGTGFVVLTSRRERALGHVRRGDKALGSAAHGWARRGADRVVLCACRGVGGDSPGPWPCHWHARITQGRRVGELRARIVLFSREGPVSRFGQKDQKSATCEPSTLQRSAWSRPPRRQRSACTSSPRRPRTRHWKWPG